MKVEIRNMNEKLETLMKQPPPVKEKSRIEGEMCMCTCEWLKIIAFVNEEQKTIKYSLNGLL